MASLNVMHHKAERELGREEEEKKTKAFIEEVIRSSLLLKWTNVHITVRKIHINSIQIRKRIISKIINKILQYLELSKY